MLYGKKGEQIKSVKKKTTQGQGKRSKAKGDRKLSRGQG